MGDMVVNRDESHDFKVGGSTQTLNVICFDDALPALLGVALKSVTVLM
jgi:hypothetical protein